MRLFLLSACAVTLVGFPGITSAQLLVSEVMYDLQTGADSGREWIEVFNASDASVSIAEWKLFEGASNHVISAMQGGELIPSGGYAIVADNPVKFLVDWPGYAGLLFDSVFSGGLSNTGESVTFGYMKDGSLVPTDTVAYQSAWGGAGDGMSLQRATSDSASFSGGAPTPGTGALLLVPGLHTPSDTIEEPVIEQSTTTSSDTHTPASPTLGVVSSYVAPPEPLIYAYAGKDRDVIAGADVVYEGQAYDKKGTWLSASTTRFSWNFGDGSIGEGSQIFHHFNVPGRYAVVLNVANNTNAASSKIVVNVHPVSITMNELAGALVLTNTSGFELDLTDWFFKSENVLFRFPKNTTLLAHSSAAFTASTTGITDTRGAVLLYPNGTTASTVGSSISAVSQTSAPRFEVAPIPQTIKKASPALKQGGVEDPTVEPIAEINTGTGINTSTALTAAAAATGFGHVWWFAAAALAVGSAAAASLISRTKKNEWDIEESE